jgi:hypothetical protein
MGSGGRKGQTARGPMKQEGEEEREKREGESVSE